MSDETYNATGSTADRAVETLHRIDDKVAMLRKQRLEDPDSATDKLIKSVLPAITGMVAGKLFQVTWDRAQGATEGIFRRIFQQRQRTDDEHRFRRGIRCIGSRDFHAVRSRIASIG